MDGGLVYFIRNVIFTREAIGRAGVCVCVCVCVCADILRKSGWLVLQ